MGGNLRNACVAAFRAEIKKSFKADIPRLSAQIKQHKDEINKLVYELFDLTQDEIEPLEASI